MEDSKTHTIQLTSEQKSLFDAWLEQAEKELEAKLTSIKSLRKQTEPNQETTSGTKSMTLKSANQSWTSKVVHILKQVGEAQSSTQIIAWLMDNDEDLKGKNKRYITKNVTSKLAILVDKGQLEKKVVDGKNVYSIKNQG